MDKTQNNPGLSKIFFKFIGGFSAGVAGTIILSIIIFFSYSIIGDTLTQDSSTQTEFGLDLEEKETHPLFLSIIIAAIFLSSLVANNVYALINSVLEDKEDQKYTHLTHVFFGNVIVLIFMLPLYLISKNNVNGVALAAFSHAIISMVFSFLVTESLYNAKHIIVNIYGLVLGLAIFMVYFSMSIENTTVLMYTTFPMFLGVINSCKTITEMFYDWLQDSYGSDFLSTEKRFGNDYRKEEIEVIDYDDI
jgi:hypothetical protein